MAFEPQLTSAPQTQPWSPITSSKWPAGVGRGGQHGTNRERRMGVCAGLTTGAPGAGFPHQRDSPT